MGKQINLNKQNYKIIPSNHTKYKLKHDALFFWFSTVKNLDQ